MLFKAVNRTLLKIRVPFLALGNLKISNDEFSRKGIDFAYIYRANIYRGDEEQDNAAVIYDDSQEIIQFTFNTSEPSVPKITLTKYKKELSNDLTTSTLDADFEGYSFVGLEFWELRTQSSVNVADSKIISILSKSNQAKPPFSYYRHSPIYIFPTNITLSKFIGGTALPREKNCHRTAF